MASYRCRTVRDTTQPDDPFDDSNTCTKCGFIGRFLCENCLKPFCHLCYEFGMCQCMSCVEAMREEARYHGEGKYGHSHSGVGGAVTGTSGNDSQ